MRQSRHRFRSILLLLLLLTSVLDAEETDIGPEVEQPPHQIRPGLYTKTSRDSVIVATNDEWYLEEFDKLERPVEGVLWKKGEIVEQKSWSYHGETGIVFLELLTNENETIETEYDGKGRCIRVETEASSGDTELTLYSWDNKDKLSESLVETKKKSVRTVYMWDGEDLSEKIVYIDGILSLRYQYKDQENWSETVYTKGKPALVVEFENGTRRRRPYGGRK
ncbi:MAG: hypothetical protein JW875_07985 [Spirochaetales bacterium]|nr:hypothetical protein [Spirochaetales bacterium]